MTTRRKGLPSMFDARTMVIIAAIGAVLFVGDKIVHSKPVQKVNHGICRVVTLGQKCKPQQAVTKKN